MDIGEVVEELRCYGYKSHICKVQTGQQMDTKWTINSLESMASVARNTCALWNLSWHLMARGVTPKVAKVGLRTPTHWINHRQSKNHYWVG